MWWHSALVMGVAVWWHSALVVGVAWRCAPHKRDDHVTLLSCSPLQTLWPRGCFSCCLKTSPRLGAAMMVQPKDRVSYSTFVGEHTKRRSCDCSPDNLSCILHVTDITFSHSCTISSCQKHSLCMCSCAVHCPMVPQMPCNISRDSTCGSRKLN